MESSSYKLTLESNEVLSNPIVDKVMNERIRQLLKHSDIFDIKPQSLTESILAGCLAKSPDSTIEIISLGDCSKFEKDEHFMVLIRQVYNLVSFK